MEPMPQNSRIKKILAILGVVLCAFMLAVPFIPLYGIFISGQGTIYANFINYYDIVPTNKSIAFIIISSISCLACGLAGVFFARCFFAKPQVGDKEDKFFVFGCAIFALACVLYGAICLSVTAYFGMLIGVVLGLTGVAGIILHYKVLSDI